MLRVDRLEEWAKQPLHCDVPVSSINESMTHLDLFNAQLRIEKDICYHRECGDDRHRLDVYAPLEARDVPVVLFFYGGGWRSGDKDLFEHLGRAFAVRDIIAVVVNYRLTPEVRSPAHAQDCAAATAWVSTHIHRHGGDARSVVLVGHSAGGHLAALLGADAHYLDSHGVDRRSIRGIVPISGVYDLVSHLDTTVFTSADLVREAFGETREELVSASPMAYVRPGLPPFLVMVAEDDPPGLRAQARELARALRASSNEVMLVTVRGRDHFSIVRRFGPANDPAARAITDFVHHVTRTSR